MYTCWCSTLHIYRYVDDSTSKELSSRFEPFGKKNLIRNKINQPDISISQLYCVSFKYSSICFGHPHAHHQELINCSSRLWFTVGT